MHTDGGFLHISHGWYRLDLPDAACAAGVAGVQVGGTVTGMVVLAPYIELPVNTEEDVYTRVGAPAGASVSADVAAVKTQTAAIEVDTQDIQGRLPAALVSGRIDASVGAMAANVITATAINADAITDAKVAADVTIASVTGAVGSVTAAVSVDAASVRTAVGLAAANLDTQLTAIDDFLDTEIAAILEDTGTTLDDFVDDLEARLTQALADKLTAHAAAIGTVVIGAGSTTTAVKLSTVNGAAPSATNDFYNGRVLIFTSGALAQQATSISDYDGATTTATVVALTGAPADTVTAVLA